MKTIILVLALGFSLLAQTQITKVETFLTGTKVDFYVGECGNTIPEATGKLTFCDRANNLGVVERSYGLNWRGVKKMLPNYHNQDEAYVTHTGLSIRNEDGTWGNIPNMAIPLWGTTYMPTIQNGLILPNNKILIQATNAGYVLNEYDRVTKTFTPINFPNNKYPYQVLYDTDRNLTWVFVRSSNDKYLYTYDGTSLNEIANLGNIAIGSSSETLVYKDDNIYIGNLSGLYKIDVSNYATTVPVTHYDSTTTPSLPFDRVGDLQFDSNGDLWMANSKNNDAAIVKFNITNETYDSYQLADPNNATVNIHFLKLALDQNNLIWATGSNYGGLVKLTFTGTTPNWELLPNADLTTLGYPITYNPNHIYFTNNKFYFTTHDGSTSDNDNYEVIINLKSASVFVMKASNAY